MEFFLENLLSLHPLTNGRRLQVGDQAYTSTSKLCLKEVICYPQGIDHNITAPSKLFIWKGRGNKKHLLSYRLYLDCPSSSGSTCLTECVCVCMCVCIQANVCVLGCVHHRMAICVWLFLLGRFMISIPCGCFVEIEMCFSSPRGIFFKALKGESLKCRVCACLWLYVHTCAYICCFFWQSKSSLYEMIGVKPTLVFYLLSSGLIIFSLCLCPPHHPLQHNE